MSRLLLQICTAVLALVPISTGIISMRGVRDPVIGAPPRPFIGFLILEIDGAPLFIYWQARVAQSAIGP